MSQQPISVYLPEELYERIHEAAEETNRSPEEVVVESLGILFNPLSATTDLEADLKSLASYSDEQLWAAVHRRLPWSLSLRLRELSARSKQAALSQQEQGELDTLLELVDRYMLLRSEALLLLKQRGYAVDDYVMA